VHTRKTLIVLWFCLITLGLQAATLDLGKAVYFARRGFNLDAIASPPAPGQGDWLALPRSAGKSLAIRNFGIVGLDLPGPFDLGRGASESFTIATVFQADPSLINTTGLSLFIPQVGLGWAVYLNGDLMHDELYRRHSGGLDRERSLHDVIVTLDKRSLKLGPNVLAFHIYGDPGDERTGLSGSRSLVIDNYGRISRLGQEYLDLALIGIYSLFALYHLVLFILRPKNLSYLMYVFGALLFSVFLFAKSQTAANLVGDTSILRDIEHASLFMVLPLFVAFCESALGRRVSLVAKLGLILGLVLAALLPFYRHEPLRTIWELLGGVQLVYLFGFHLGPRLVERIRAAIGRRRFDLGGFLVSDASILFLGTFVFAASAVVDALAVNSGGELSLTKYSFLFFVMGAAAILAGQFTGVYGQLEELGKSLERKVAERSAQLAEAVERQRSLGIEIEGQSRKLNEAAEAAERDLEIAARVQRGFFPTTAPKVEGWDLALVFRPAAKVSGDFFDFYVEDSSRPGPDGARGEGERPEAEAAETPDKGATQLTGLVVGDVSGHGMGAGLVSVLARSVFARCWTENGKLPLGELLGAVHRELEVEIGGVDEYITCLIVRLVGGKVEYANAAHPDLLYRRAGADKALAVLPQGPSEFRGPPLGKSDLGGQWSALRFAPGPGDLLLACTDCLEEARNPAGESYGRERLLASLAKADTNSASAALSSLIEDLEAFTESKTFDDDLTAIVLRRL
jgi:sigma-B regulation protein RsbU (phosphoserine phosphatase)